jgi:protein-tyrosine phosphatase
MLCATLADIFKKLPIEACTKKLEAVLKHTRDAYQIQGVYHFISSLMIIVFLVSAACSTSPGDTRRIPIPGTHNLRDIGGYLTRDHQQVKYGRVYRSDHLEDLNKMGHQQLTQLRLKRIYDFRNEREKENDPYTHDIEDAPPVVALPIYHGSQDPELMREKILSGDVEEGEFLELMLDTYRSLALDYCPIWAELMHGLTNPDHLPALIHCTHGKDRTGFSIALVLMSLGVSQETVMEDYLLSNQYLGSRASWYSFLAYIASFFRTPQEEVRALLEVRPAYLEAAFEAIEKEYVDFERYLTGCLQLDKEQRRQLRYLLLENPHYSKRKENDEYLKSLPDRKTQSGLQDPDRPIFGCTYGFVFWRIDSPFTSRFQGLFAFDANDGYSLHSCRTHHGLRAIGAVSSKKAGCPLRIIDFVFLGDRLFNYCLNANDLSGVAYRILFQYLLNRAPEKF